MFHLEIELGTPKELLMQRSIHEIIGLQKRMYEHKKKENEVETSKWQALMKVASAGKGRRSR